MRTLALVVILLAAPPPQDGGRAASSKPRVKAIDGGVDAPLKRVLAPMPSLIRHSAAGDTACLHCHSTSGWTDVRFNHDRTGFPLSGAHKTASCKGCHPEDFQRSVPTTCSGCHRDVHSGDLGARCEGCHDTASWASRFEADAHRRTAFPLLGAHAVIPCSECHFDASAGRRFTRSAVECIGCHQKDLARTRGTAIDHQTLGFTEGCRACHGAFRFKPARFAEHDRCYLISRGPHASIGCLGCHLTLSGSARSGSCNTGTAACTQCHEHRCSAPGGALRTDQIHAKVPGYQCGDRRCYECHQQLRVAP